MRERPSSYGGRCSGRYREFTACGVRLFDSPGACPPRASALLSHVPNRAESPGEKAGARYGTLGISAKAHRIDRKLSPDAPVAQLQSPVMATTKLENSSGLS